MKIWKLYSVGQSPKVAAHATEWRRVLGLARSYRACVKTCKNLEIISDKKKRVRSRACALTRRTTYDGGIYKQKIPLERTTRLARSRSPMKKDANKKCFSWQQKSYIHPYIFHLLCIIKVWLLVIKYIIHIIIITVEVV